MNEVERNAADFLASDAEAKAGLVLHLRQMGVRDLKVLSAIERVPRRLFLGASMQKHAYQDRALPIDCGQTVSAPSIVGMVCEALELEEEHRVLEVGAGSGFQAAILGHLCRQVYSIDRYRTLVDLARERLSSLKIANVEIVFGDGREGLREKAPFDRIVVSAAAPEPSPALLDQLRPQGIMIAPLGEPGKVQELCLLKKEDSGVTRRSLGEARFVPLVEGTASKL